MPSGAYGFKSRSRHMDYALLVSSFLTGVVFFTFVHHLVTYNIYRDLPSSYSISIAVVIFISLVFSFIGLVVYNADSLKSYLLTLGVLIVTLLVAIFEGIAFGKKYYFFGIPPFISLLFLILGKFELTFLFVSLGILLNLMLLIINIVCRNKEITENRFFFNYRVFIVFLAVLMLISFLVVFYPSIVFYHLFLTLSALSVFYPKLNYTFVLRDKLLDENRKFSQLYHSIVDEVLVAKGIIDKLLPSKKDIKNLEFDKYFRPAIIVGGDFFDIIEFSETKHFVYVSDISGHGIPAGIISAMLKTLILKNVVTHEVNLERLVKSLNSDFNSILRETGRYSTMFLALIDKNNKEIKYTSCGHTDVLYWDSSSQEFFYISSTTPILGLLDRIEVYSSFIQFDHGDYLIVPTDGIVTVTNGEGDQLGYEGLVKILKKYLSRNVHPSELIFNFSQEIERFAEDGEILDDMTLLAIRL